MPYGLYLSAEGAHAQSKRLETIANNLANVNTVGFKRQLAVQHSWADNAVSATISFNKENPEELAACLEKYAPRLKSTSCLPRAHGYAQAPYEVIDADYYARLAGQINFDHPLTKGGEFEIEECSTGACPVR